MATKIFNIALPNDLVREADRVAKREYKNRSELIREALRRYIEELEWQRLQRIGTRQTRKLGLKEKDLMRLIREYRAGK